MKMVDQLEFRILGPLTAVHEGRPVHLGGRRPRTLLAALLVHAGAVVPADQLIEAIWPRRPPLSAAVTLRTHVAALRKALMEADASTLLVTGAGGYGLMLQPAQLDATQFERLAADGRLSLQGGNLVPARRALQTALALWRGPVLADLERPAFAEAAIARLDELRLVTIEDRVDAELALGACREMVAELEQLVDGHPFRERLCAQLMLALYRSDRQADALAVYRATRRRLRDELGLTPGRVLRELETAILRHEPALDGPGPVFSGGSVPRDSDPGTDRVAAGAPIALLDLVQRGPLVGRDKELRALRTRWEQVRAGHRRVVLISGDAGVGKSRLVAELASLAEPRARLLVGHCELESVTAYQPLAEAMRTSPEVIATIAAADEGLRRRLAALIGGLPIQLDQLARGSFRPTESIEPSGQDPAQERAALFEAVARLLAQLGTHAPVMFVVEDMDRIDRASSLLMQHLIGFMPAAVLMVLTFRDPPGSQHPPLRDLLAEIERRGTAERIQLQQFDERQLATLMTAVTGSEPPAAAVRTLWQRTGGNPFYATEVMRHRDSLTGPDHPVPTSVRDVLRARVEALPDPVRWVLASAALIGGDIDFGLLQAVADLPEEQFVEAVEHATRSGLLAEVGRTWATTYAFSHALVREAVYADISLPQRLSLHLRTAKALQAAGLRNNAEVAAAATHLRMAVPLADAGQAAELSLRAADVAQRLYAWDEAATHTEAALELLERIDAPLAHRAAVAERAGELRWVASANLRKALESLTVAFDYYRLVGDPRSAARVQSRLGLALSTHPTVMDIPRALECLMAAATVLVDAPAAWHVHNGIAYAAVYGLRTDRLGVASSRAMQIANEWGRRDRWGWSAAARAYYHFYRGDVAATFELHEQTWQAAQQAGDPNLGWMAARARSLFSTAYLNDPRTAEHWCRRGLALPRLDLLVRQRDDLIDSLALACGVQGNLDAARRLAAELAPDAVVHRFLALWEGRWEEAEASWASALRTDQAAGDLLDATMNALWLAGVKGVLGRAEEAVAVLRRALAWSTAGPHVPAELAIRAQLTQMLSAAGHLDEAAGQLARCDEILAGGEDWRGRVGDVALARAVLTAAQGQMQPVDAAFTTALEQSRRYRLPWLRAAILLAWGRALADQHLPIEAGDRVRAARGVYRQIGAGERWSNRADQDAALESAEPTATAVAPNEASQHALRPVLSDREVEVLRLVAAGLNDREIGARLTLSPHTVHRHVANIRTKLGQPSRAAAVAHASRVHLI